MSANVETMFYVREKPWHGLGTMVQEAPTSADALRLAAQGVEVTTSSVAEYLDVTNKTIRYMVDEHPDFERDTKTGQIRRAHTVAPQE